MNLMRGSCIRIPIQYEKEVWCQSILQDLTRSGSSFDDPTIKVTSVYYDKRDGNLWIPRFYEVEKFGHKCIDYIPDGEDIDFKFTTGWRNDLQRAGFEFLTQETRGILKLKPGEGKTVISIGAICAVGKKVIIFVHKDSLVTQWKERFLQHSNVKDEDISILRTGSRYEDLQKPIVLSTVQTMNSMINRVPDIEEILVKANFGMGIWDECHTTSGAEQYSKTSLYLPCKRVFGLSATPGRPDQNHDIIWRHLGMVYEPEGQSSTLKPRIVMIYFDHKVISNHKRYVYWGPPGKDGKTKLPYPRFDTSRYLGMLTSKKNDVYIPMMQKIVKKIYDAGRIALLISDRIKVLDGVAKVVPKHDAGFFIPRSGKERDNELLKQMVFSTPGSSRDGTDREALDCLVMANRISNLDQAIGRICRPKANKKDPVVFDIVDTGCTELAESAEKRKEFYKQKGWEVEEKFLK